MYLILDSMYLGETPPPPQVGRTMGGGRMGHKGPIQGRCNPTWLSQGVYTPSSSYKYRCHMPLEIHQKLLPLSLIRLDVALQLGLHTGWVFLHRTHTVVLLVSLVQVLYFCCSVDQIPQVVIFTVRV